MKRIRRTASVAGGEKPSNQWRTPVELFAALHGEFVFQIDLAANAENHLLNQWFGQGGLAPNALVETWLPEFGPGFLNPPYAAVEIAAFMEKAARASDEGFTTVALVPHDPSTRWWQWTRRAVEIREIPHRVPYLKADGTSKAGAMFASAIVVFRPQPGIVRGQPRRVVWTWRTDVGKGAAKR